MTHLSSSQKRWGFLLGFVAVLTLLLACDAVNSITTNPLFLCASPTPVPTDTPFPTSLPTYPWAFSANVDYTFYLLVPGQAFGLVNIQYMAQSTGYIQLQYNEYDQYGGLLLAQSAYSIADAPVGAVGLNGVFPLSITSFSFR